jgi:TonB family protein
MPEPLGAMRPEYPPEAAAARLEATVVLRVSIDAEGNVTEAEVIEPVGHGFDEAARAAALRARYRPARRGDNDVASRVLVRVEFRLPQAPPTGSLEGRLLLPGTGAASAAGVEVIARASDGSTQTMRTDEEGRFRFDALTAGSYTVVARAPGLGRVELRTEVVASQRIRITARLEPSGAEAPIEVTVRGTSEADRRRQSAEAVSVVETERAKRESADMGEVLARTQGVGVQRGGGFGSETRFSLNGLSDDQVRLFLDGIPLELAGYPFGIANVPVNLVERAEVYRGVVPIRFGADALGGAVNLVTENLVEGTHGSASYQAGSFGTHRTTLGATHWHKPAGFFTRIGGFFDHADNDYPIDVEVPDDRGRVSPARVYSFHDAYRAAGGNLEAGFVNRPWAKRLSLHAFATDYRDEIQHDVVMAVPYGDVELSETAVGGVLRYKNTFGERVSLEALAGYTYGALAFVDLGECIYSWFGQCVRDRAQPGEVAGVPLDRRIGGHDVFGRTNLQWRPHPQHALRISVAPSFTTRTGEERRRPNPDVPDPLAAQRDLVALVGGLEDELDLFDGRLENIVFVKSYVQLLRSKDALSSGMLRDRDRDTIRFGGGDALRYRFVEWLYAKASYEFATRLPRPDEVFGNGGFIVANLELQPEVSHNANLGLTLDARDTPAGASRADVNGFVRAAEQLIRLFGSNRVQTYQNVFSARALGVEAAAGWTSPREYVALDGNITCVDFRNTSTEGLFENHTGDRIPNRPYLFANASATLKAQGVTTPRDELSLTWNARYVHEFFRGWESIGDSEFKLTVPSQLLHSLVLAYQTTGDPVSLSFTGEVQNLTDQPAFDFFGVQRPGRAFYFKTTAAF